MCHARSNVPDEQPSLPHIQHGVSRRFFGFSAASLAGSKEVQTAVMVRIVVPVHKLIDPVTGFFQRRKSLRLIVGAILQNLEQTFRIRIVVADSWSAVGWCDAQLIQCRQHGCALHRRSVVGMQYERFGCEPSLFQCDTLNKVTGKLCAFFFVDFPANDAAVIQIGKRYR